MKWSSLFCLILFSAILSDCLGQNINRSKIAVQNFCDTIPFEYFKGKIIVEVAIHDQSKRFIFDTGAPLLISDELQSTLNAPVIGSGSVIDVVGNTVSQSIVSIPSLALGKIFFKDAVGMVYTKEKTDLLNCFKVDGLIGSTLLKHCIVQINLDKQFIILTDRLGKLDVTNAFQSKLKLDVNSRPFITIDLQDRGEVEALFDSGSDKFLPLSLKGFNNLKPSQSVKVLNTGMGSISSGLYGAGKPGIENRIALGDIKWGGYQIQAITTTVSEHKNKNALGMGLAKYGIITLDYLNKRFYFKGYSEIQQFKESGFLGFNLQLNNGKYFISTVYDHTEAESLGLKYGYIVQEVNGTRVMNSDKDTQCNLFLSDFMEQDRIELTYRDNIGNTKTVEIRKP